MGALVAVRIRCLTFLVMLLIIAACSGSAPQAVSVSVSASPSVSAAEKPPCDVAAARRARVPRLMKQGKLHRTGRVIEKANRLCPATARETWAADFYTPRLLAKLLSGDTSYLEPEFESAPLSCAASSP
jgi:hypothetical protein